MSFASALHCFGLSLTSGRRVAELQRFVDVALDVEVARDVRAAEAELTRRGDDAPQRVRRADDDRRAGFVLRRAESASVVGSDRDREVGTKKVFERCAESG